MNEKKNYTTAYVIICMLFITGIIVGDVVQRRGRPEFLKDKTHRFYAVVAGYDYPPMNGTGRTDALAFAEFLTNDLNLPRSYVKVLADEEGFTKAQLKEEVKNLVENLHFPDTLLIYYSGFGVPQNATEPFTQLGTYYNGKISESIGADELEDWTTAPTGNITMILDVDYARNIYSEMLSNPPKWAFLSCDYGETKAPGESVFTREFLKAYGEENSLNTSKIESFDSVNSTIISETNSFSGQHPIMINTMGNELVISC